MRFAEPYWLLGGLAFCGLLLWIYSIVDRRRHKALMQFASVHLLGQLTASFSRQRLWIRRALLLGGIALIFIALARPQWGFRWEEAKRKGIDILFAVDTSKSMLAQDVKPNRLTRAKLAVTDLVSKLGGDRVGLIAFAGTAFLQSPLTLDYDAFQQTLDALDIGVIPEEGTDIASAIEAAEDAFGKEEKNIKILVLITDGEDLEAKGIESAKAAKSVGLKIYTVGVGSSTGELIPVPTGNGSTEFLKDENGNFVKSHLDESTLKQMAEATGGRYEPLGARGEGLEAIYKEALAPLPKQEIMSHMQRIFTERFQWPLALGIACLLAELFVGTRARRRRPPAFAPITPEVTPRRSPRSTVISLFLILMLSASAQADPPSAEEAYKKGDYAEAEKQYAERVEKDPNSPELQFNLGDAAYKARDYDKAISAFQKALQADKLDLQQKSYYNLGNTQYRKGQQTLINSNLDDSIRSLEDAVQSYDSALKLKPEDANCKSNRKKASQKLEVLKKLQQQQKSQQGQGKKGQKGKDSKEDKDNQSKDGQSGEQDSSGKASSGKETAGNQASKGGEKGAQKDDKQSAEGKQANAMKEDDKKSGDDKQANAQKPGDDKQANGAKQGDEKSGDDKQANALKQDEGKKEGDSKNSVSKEGEQKDGKDAAGKIAQGKEAKTPDQAPDAKPSSATAQAKEGKSEENKDEGPSVPGQMSRQEAMALLNSVKGDERAFPTGGDSKQLSNTQTHRKNW